MTISAKPQLARGGRTCHNPTPPTPPIPSRGDITLTFIRHEEPFTTKGWSITPFKGWVNKWSGNRPIALWHDDAEIDPHACPAELGLKHGDVIIVFDEIPTQTDSTAHRLRVISGMVGFTDPPFLVAEEQAASSSYGPTGSATSDVNDTPEPRAPQPDGQVLQLRETSHLRSKPCSNFSLSSDESSSQGSDTDKNGDGLTTSNESPGLSCLFRKSMTLN
ncbi:hypothetical protein CspeluHIS016_0101040 [Cutaneotrichosporon spelunceum]|uniref:Uncharacterized protein n=1 Tax=Cutaneotrichosporon spelunceum TaxID=1672016 RepID=A0AAD3TLU8_9TREE|nr:hypothetical protein CspeluHIS016_0101040 [Cutaneotrichosporon spelunceum]